jgi:hypothetical protein
LLFGASVRSGEHPATRDRWFWLRPAAEDVGTVYPIKRIDSARACHLAGMLDDETKVEV